MKAEDIVEKHERLEREKVALVSAIGEVEAILRIPHADVKDVREVVAKVIRRLKKQEVIR